MNDPLCRLEATTICDELWDYFEVNVFSRHAYFNLTQVIIISFVAKNTVIIFEIVLMMLSCVRIPYNKKDLRSRLRNIAVQSFYSCF